MANWSSLGSARLGMFVMIGRPMSNSAGLAVLLSIGVALKCSKADLRSVSDSLHFLMICLTVATVRSASPFDLGKYGLEVMC